MVTRSWIGLLLGFGLFVAAGLVESGDRLHLWPRLIGSASTRRFATSATSSRWLRTYLALVHARIAGEPPALSH